jgi:tRNA pseudouridine32 synthase/23S rRNA pseudouridine746 synthase
MPSNSLNQNDRSEDQTSALFEWHITISNNEPNTTPIAVLERYADEHNIVISKTALKQAVNKGALWLTPLVNKKRTQRLRRIKKQLAVGDELHFYYNRDVLSCTVPEAKLIADLVGYSVWYKPYGMLSQGSKWSDHCTIARYAQQHLPVERPAFIVHRLDRAATGLILIAHSKKIARTLSKMFEQHQLEKIYHIVVHGNHQQRPQPDIITTEIANKSACSQFTCIDFDKDSNRSLVKVSISSGRKHQIRIHAASIGMPVVGDRLHGIADENEALNLQLCAVNLRFYCPIKQLKQINSDDVIDTKPMSFEVPETLRPQLSLRS